MRSPAGRAGLRGWAEEAGESGCGSASVRVSGWDSGGTPGRTERSLQEVEPAEELLKLARCAWRQRPGGIPGTADPLLSPSGARSAAVGNWLSEWAAGSHRQPFWQQLAAHETFAPSTRFPGRQPANASQGRFAGRLPSFPPFPLDFTCVPIWTELRSSPSAGPVPHVSAPGSLRVTGLLPQRPPSALLTALPTRQPGAPHSPPGFLLRFQLPPAAPASCEASPGCSRPAPPDGQHHPAGVQDELCARRLLAAVHRSDAHQPRGDGPAGRLRPSPEGPLGGGVLGLGRGFRGGICLTGTSPLPPPLQPAAKTGSLPGG